MWRAGRDGLAAVARALGDDCDWQLRERAFNPQREQLEKERRGRLVCYWPWRWLEVMTSKRRRSSSRVLKRCSMPR